MDSLQESTIDHHELFHLLAGGSNKLYKEFGVERSLIRVLYGFMKRFPTVLNAMYVKGNITTTPLGILVDEN